MPLSLPIGSKYIPYETPIHITILVFYFIKTIFKIESESSNTFKWFYDPNDYSKCKINFDLGYNKEANILGGIPLVVVNRLPINNEVLSVNDEKFGENFKKSVSWQQTYVRSGVDVVIKSKAALETEILGNYIYNILLAYRTILPNITTITRVENLTLSQIEEVKEDDIYYQVHITLNYIMPIKWGNYINSDVLKSISLTVKDELANNSLQVIIK